MKLKDLKEKEASLAKILGSEHLSQATSFRLKPFVRAIRRVLTDFEESRVELVKKLGDVDNFGNFKIIPSKKTEYELELNSLLEQDVDIKLPEILLKEVESVNLTAVDMELLDGIVVESHTNPLQKTERSFEEADK